MTASTLTILGLVTARGGSKSIPRKNLAMCAGKSLLAWTAEAALSSGLARVVLSTDDVEIAEAGRAVGLDVPFLRPPELASDTAKSIDVALHAVDFVRKESGHAPDAVMILQPTSPLRTTRHIDEAIALFIEKNADTVVSVVPVPHRFSPYAVMSVESDRLVDFIRDPLPFDRFRRQDVPPTYARNGPAVLITRTSVLETKRSFYGERTLPYIMGERESVDIDYPQDLALADYLLGHPEAQR